MNATIEHYFLTHSKKDIKEILTPQQIEEYKKTITEILKTTQLLEAEIDIAIRQKLNLPIYPTDKILEELIKEGKIGQLSNGKYYLKKKEKEKTTLDAWFK